VTPTCRGGIIAAGDGSRLRATGFSMPKPLVPVAGVALIDGVIGNFRGAGITSLVIIVNEQARACRDWVHSRFPDLDIEVIVKTTPSSLESFREVTRRLGGDRALISTVDTWCRADDFAAFVHAALRRPADASVLAVTPLVADERPLWVDVGPDGRDWRLGGHTRDCRHIYALRAGARRRAAAVGKPERVPGVVARAGRAVLCGDDRGRRRRRSEVGRGAGRGTRAWR